MYDRPSILFAFFFNPFISPFLSCPVYLLTSILPFVLSSSYASYICKAYHRRLQPDSEAIEPRVGIDRLIDCFYCVWIYWDESGIETIGMNRFHDESSPRTGKYFGPIVADTSRLRTIFAIVHFANNHENILSLPSLIARARYSSIRSHFRVQRFPFTHLRIYSTNHEKLERLDKVQWNSKTTSFPTMLLHEIHIQVEYRLDSYFKRNERLYFHSIHPAVTNNDYEISLNNPLKHLKIRWSGEHCEIRFYDLSICTYM